MKSESIGALAKALIKAKSKFKMVVKDKENPFFHSLYAPLENIVDASDQALHEHGLVIIQTTGFEGEKFGLITTLAHESGEFVSGFYHLNPAKANDPQALAASTTYGRRAALAAILGICPESDDDGNVASGKHDQSSSKQELVKTNGNGAHGSKLTFIPAATSEKSGEKNGKSWTQWGIKSPDGNWYSTFDEKFADLAIKAKENGTDIELEYTMNGKYRNVVSVVAVIPF